ncbi:MAG: hypothetical protein R2831_12810 [Chitinophagaceae bacterium]
MKKYVFIIITFLFSCVKDKPNPNITNNTTEEKQILILNEGAFGNNNSEISILSSTQQKVITNTAYANANATSMGDIAQSMIRIQNTLYVCINNSNRILALNPNTFELKTSINSVLLPRYIAPISSQYALVGTLYQNEIFVLNTETNNIVSSIQMPYKNAEAMVSYLAKTYVCLWDTACHAIYQIDNTTQKIDDSITIQVAAPREMLLDINNNAWILCGNKYQNKKSFLLHIDLANKQVIRQYTFDANAEPMRLTMNETKDSLYFILVNYQGTQPFNGVYCMSITDQQLANTPIIQAPNNSYFWGIGINPHNQHIYVSDPKGFTQSSTVFEYTKSGEFIQSFSTGIGSNQFYFSK